MPTQYQMLVEVAGEVVGVCWAASKSYKAVKFKIKRKNLNRFDYQAEASMREKVSASVRRPGRGQERMKPCNSTTTNHDDHTHTLAILTRIGLKFMHWQNISTKHPEIHRIRRQSVNAIQAWLDNPTWLITSWICPGLEVRSIVTGFLLVMQANFFSIDSLQETTVCCAVQIYVCHGKHPSLPSSAIPRRYQSPLSICLLICLKIQKKKVSCPK